jgi:hypothetical protein
MNTSTTTTAIPTPVDNNDNISVRKTQSYDKKKLGINQLRNI